MKVKKQSRAITLLAFAVLAVFIIGIVFVAMRNSNYQAGDVPVTPPANQMQPTSVVIKSNQSGALDTPVYSWTITASTTKDLIANVKDESHGPFVYQLYTLSTADFELDLMPVLEGGPATYVKNAEKTLTVGTSIISRVETSDQPSISGKKWSNVWEYVTAFRPGGACPITPHDYNYCSDDQARDFQLNIQCFTNTTESVSKCDDIVSTMKVSVTQ